ncbi:barstar family protein [Zavarzinella formosa]|uniref:barstar family protein n=1 Tax=Zavarzinella formosa TaxID=360055 RepID=UPI0002EC7F6E|nr:barstar family protein [Zavarzinella formosa]
MKEFIIDGSRFADWDGFLTEVNRELITPDVGHWDGNLDAFHDYLNLVELESERYRLIWRRSEESRRCIGLFDLIVQLIRDEAKVELALD